MEAVTATVAGIYIAGKVSERVERSRQRRKLTKLAATLTPGMEVGEHYGPWSGWYIKAATGTGTLDGAQ